MNPKLEKVIEKTRSYIKIAKPELIIIAAVLFLDILTKVIVTNTFNLGESRTVIPNFLNWHYTRNPFAAFGSAFGLDRIFATGTRHTDPARFIPFLIVAVIASIITWGVIFLLNKNKIDIKSQEGKKFYIKVGVAIAIIAIVLCVFYAIIMQFRYHMMPFFVTMTIVAVAAFSFMLYRHRGRQKAGLWVRIGLALIISGALGNWFDRIVLGEVIDFIEIVFFGQTIFGHSTFAIFNLADSALTVGVVVFAIGYIRGETKKEEKTEQVEEVTQEDIDYRAEDSEHTETNDTSLTEDNLSEDNDTNQDIEASDK
ncbi:MAG: signal peptidase II [Firmicutes bacterium]|nr:signal peptidase II [Bacillota bacterium]